MLLDAGLGLQANRIFWPVGKRTAQKIVETTGSRGVDVIYSSSQDGLKYGYQVCLADFGRFIEVGATQELSGQGYDPKECRSNTTFSSVDLDILIEKRPALATR